MTETDRTAELTITRVLDAPRDLVWRAWTDDELARLAMATERYCVVGQSLAHPPSIHVRRRSPESGGSAG